jgi:hypothetical protein
VEQFTREQLEAMKTAELLKLYNRLSPKKVKRFESRKSAVEKLLKLLAERAATEAALPVRTVTPMGKSKAGRPTLSFSITANSEGKSEVRESSLRGQIMAHIKTLPNATVTIAELETKFGAKARAAVQKLIANDWVRRTPEPVGTGG